MAARMMLVVLAAGLSCPLAANGLPDPTEPPAAFSAGGGVEKPGMSLTAIKKLGNKRIAIIGGQEVAVGERYQDARMLRISDSEVTLRRGGETIVLKLYPQVEKRPRGQ